MAKKVVKIEKNKKSKNENKKNDSKELFNLNEEIVIGINSKNVIKEKNNKNQSKKNNNKKANNSKSVSKKNSKAPNKNKAYRKDEIKEKKSHKWIKIILVIFLLVLLLVILLLSPIFNITAIYVKGNSKISKQEIISLSQIQLGENIFKYINIKIMQNIKTNPYIDEVKITRNYPSEITIEVKERENKYMLKINETYYSISTQGYILDKSIDTYQLPEIIGYKTETIDIILGNRLIDDDLEQLEKINTLNNYLEEDGIKEKILNYTIGEDEIIIGLNDNRQIYVQSFTNLSIKMISLKNVLERTEGKSGKILLDGQGEDHSILFRETV